MKKRVVMFCLVLMMLGILVLAGCGSSSDSKSGSGVKLTPASTEYPNAGLLVTADSVQANLSNKNLIIIDARGKSGYETSHIPGAINLIHNNFWTWGTGLKPVAELQTLLGEAGLTRNKTYVIYDNTAAAWGAAGRIFWMLEYLGCTDVHILNGGWDKWAADGRTTEVKTNTLPPATFTAAVKESVKSTKESIASQRTKSNFAIIDARADEEYIGWQLYGEARGGHIPGAINISYTKFFNTDKTVLSYTDLKTLFESRGITRNKTVTAHCTVGIRSGFVYFTLRLMGYANASNYDASIVEWAAADATTYPMEKMAHYEALVSPQWVKNLIDGENPATYPGNGYVIIFTSWWPRYETNESSKTGAGTPFATAGHIPGAIFLDTYSVETGPTSEYEGYADPSHSYVKKLSVLQAHFASMGITKDKTVIVYADDDITMMTAGRIAWALLYAGVNDVRILNGGYKAWTAAGYTVETGATAWTAVGSFGVSSGHPEYITTTADLQKVIDGIDTGSIIVDDRAWDEYIGASNSYYTWFDEKGRIPTAKWIGDWTDIVSADHQSFIPFADAQYNWTQKGFTADKKMYFYCGGGARSAMYTFYAYMMGWPAANYEGGWYLWSTDDENDRETGIPE